MAALRSECPVMLRFTLIIPAFNEEACLAPTLDSVHVATERLRARPRVDVETIVVDNNSDDGTATVARNRGATVIHEPVQGIARARNTGARHATGDVLVFVDADVIVPPSLL
ncbi:MAG: glycosyltransferase family 2 protein, partial [Acidobacteria bacterium]|nr:glycosyltransferase family 2 protein [Acidobacteriota bacterium]